METELEFRILPQPNDTTCGPTCLHSIYQYFGDDISLDQVIRETPSLDAGGTLGVHLGCHALRRGYQARMYTYNLHVFDPTWFRGDGVDLRAKIAEQMKHKRRAKFRFASKGYLEYLDLGGQIRFRDLSPELIRKYLRRSIPILTGLSATHLYGTMREYGPNGDDDDIRGEPVGHFVVLCGYDPVNREVRVADPNRSMPMVESRMYSVPIERAIGSIFLGIVTYDANLLIIEPKTPVAGRKPELKEGPT
ncbi:hypothetical protein HZA57_09135 [Candidatus Poribacteria bacterium]|nr:hypothetical protein [Candidatus Poribacteria bacterium]